MLQSVREGSGGIQALGGLPGAAPRFDTGFLSYASAVSGDGSVVVGGSRATSDPTADSSEAFRWTGATGMQSLGVLPGAAESYATGISADGAAIVGVSDSQAFRWTGASGMVGLGNLNGGPGGGGYSEAADVSGDGSVIVGLSESGTTTEAYRWTLGGEMAGLGFLSGDVASGAYAVSGDGRAVAGVSVDANNRARAFVWHDLHGMQDLRTALAASGLAGDVAGWEFTEATGLVRNADGSLTVLVNGFHPTVGQRAVLARYTPVPEPASLAALGLGALALLRRRKA